MVKSRSALAVIFGILVMSASGCGGGSKQVSSNPAVTHTSGPSVGPNMRSGGDEGPGDVDDRHVPNDDTRPSSGSTYKATAADEGAVVALAKHYYAVALAGDGAKACSLLDAAMAKSLPEDYGRAPGPSFLRGKTCATVASKLFEHFHREIAIEAPALQVASVRFSGDHGTAILSFGDRRLPKLEFLVQREHGTWKAGAPLGFAS